MNQPILGIAAPCIKVSKKVSKQNMVKEEEPKFNLTHATIYINNILLSEERYCLCRIELHVPVFVRLELRKCCLNGHQHILFDALGADLS